MHHQTTRTSLDNLATLGFSQITIRLLSGMTEGLKIKSIFRNFPKTRLFWLHVYSAESSSDAGSTWNRFESTISGKVDRGRVFERKLFIWFFWYKYNKLEI